MDKSIQICHRLIYLYNIAHEEEPLFLNTNNYPVESEQIYRTVDMIINSINYSNLSDDLKRIWMEDKFAYVTWVRDILRNTQST